MVDNKKEFKEQIVERDKLIVKADKLREDIKHLDWEIPYMLRFVKRLTNIRDDMIEQLKTIEEELWLLPEEEPGCQE